MPMTVVVTNDVPDRYRGFLASCMLEIAPGVYTAPRLSAGVRERVWNVLSDWWGTAPGGSVVMTWPDRRHRGGQEVRSLGLPQKTLWEQDGLHLVFTPPTPPTSPPEDPGSA